MGDNAKLLLMLIVVFQSWVALSQYDTTINTRVLDRNTKQPISYVNVGFVNKEIGTVSNKNGRFYLKYDESKVNGDIFLISHLGYKSVKIPSEQLFDELAKSNIIELEPIDNDEDNANEILIKREARDSIGYISYDSNKLVNWSNKKSLGGEVGTLIKLNKEKSKLESLRFMIVENTSDSLLVRINIYDKKNSLPNQNLLKNNIYHTISRKKGEEIIDLSAYNIMVDTDFILGLELISVYGKDFLFKASAGKGGVSFTKSISQNRWKNRKNEGIAFKVDISYPILSNKRLKRQKPNEIVLYWDTSLSRQSHDLKKELMFVDQYISEIQNVIVHVVPFSDTLGEKKHFEIEKGNTKDLLELLSKLRYNGASNFSELFKEDSLPDQYLVFTDGVTTFGEHQFIYDVPVFYINSNKIADNIQLQQGGLFSDGHYLNLLRMSLQEALTYIDQTLDDSVRYNKTDTKKILSGKVYSDGVPVQGCKVSIKGTLTQAITDREGNFVIQARVSQVLSFQHFSMKSKDVTYDGLKSIEVELKSKYQNLNEVVLQGKKKRSKKEELYHIARKAALGKHVFTKEEIPKEAFDLETLIRRTIFDVKVIRVKGVIRFVARRARAGTSNIQNVLFVVNNIPLAQPPYNLDTSEIETMYFLNSGNAHVRYGNQGENGAIVINTTGAFGENDDPKNSLLIKGNDYNETSFLLNPNKNKPEYLTRLYKSKTYNNALDVYYKLRKYHQNEVPFYVYCSEYFKQWNRTFSKQIISNVVEIAGDNFIALRTLAFQLEKDRDYKNALVIYEKLYDLKSDYVQSSLDLGRMYKINKEYDKAFSIYKKILENDAYVDGKYTDVYRQAESEIRQLFNHHRSYFKEITLPIGFLVVKGAPVRIVFEWNDPQAEFEFQIVTPNKKYDRWTHRFEKNKELFQEELEFGIMSKEFIVDDSLLGEWIINVQSFDEVTQLNPTFLKYTIYKNYGLPGETKTVRLVKLYNQNEKVTLDKFTI